MKILIGIPAFNEEKNIGSIIANIKKKYSEILVCDDGSSDNTKLIATNMGANVISHSTNLGYGSAIKTIFNHAKKMDFDILVTFDSDGQHIISEIDSVVKPIIENKSDIVIGSRFLKSSKNIPKYRKFGIKTITTLTNVATGNDLSDSQSGFRAYSRSVIDKISLVESGMGISTEILIKASKNNFSIAEVPITVIYNENSHSQKPISHGTSVVISTIKHVAIDRPLLYYGVTGICFLILGLIFGGWALHVYSEENRVITNIALIGIGGVILGTILLISATILYSINTLIREK